jgi:hypothetical protein
LLELVEGRNATPLREAMIRLEHGVRQLLSDGGSPAAKPMLDATPLEAEAPAVPAPAMPAPPPRPVLVQRQTVQGRIPMPQAPRPAEPEHDPAVDPGADDANEALVELTSMGRSDPEDIVKEPPEIPTPVAQIIRRLSSDSAAAGAVASDA